MNTENGKMYKLLFSDSIMPFFKFVKTSNFLFYSYIIVINVIVVPTYK